MLIISILTYFISLIIDFILNKLSSSKYKLNKILIMEEKSQKAYSSIAINEIQCYKRKLIGFFIISFILLLFFWYYCSALCSIYRNCQKFWLLWNISHFCGNMIQTKSAAVNPDRNGACIFWWNTRGCSSRRGRSCS